MRNTKDTIAFLANQRKINSHSWYQKCLQLTRTARDLPAVYPSAVAAQHATPEEDRVYDLDKVVGGMVGFFDDPRDSNPYGHVVTFHTVRAAHDVPVTWTNDARERGAVDLTRFDFFPTHWGDNFQFAAKSLNGFDLDLPEIGQKGQQKKDLKKKGKARLEDMVQELEKMIEFHQRKGHDRLVKALTRDKNKILDHIKEFS